MDVDACDEAVRHATTRDPVVSQLFARITKSLGAPPAIICVASTGGDERVRTARAFFSADAFDEPNPQPPEIVVVAPRVANDVEVLEVLRHELTHARDHCEEKRDLRLCEELACSEVRAHVVAECSDVGSRMADSLSCRFPASWLAPSACETARKTCVRRLAVRATSNLFPPSEARECVDRVFERCFASAMALEVESVGGGVGAAVGVGAAAGVGAGAERNEHGA